MSERKERRAVTIEELIAKLREAARQTNEGISEPVWLVSSLEVRSAKGDDFGGTDSEHYFDTNLEVIDVLVDSERGCLLIYKGAAR